MCVHVYVYIYIYIRNRSKCVKMAHLNLMKFFRLTLLLIHNDEVMVSFCSKREAMVFGTSGHGFTCAFFESSYNSFYW